MPSSALDAKFLFFFLLSQRRHLLSSRMGGAQPNISQQLIRELAMPLPPRAEQSRIVAEIEKQFTRLDSVETQLAAAHRRTQQLARGIAIEAFARNHPTKPLREIASIKGGLTMHSDRPDLEDCVAVPYLRVANVQRGYLDLSVVKTIMGTHSEINELLLEPGDILFTEGGDRDKLGRGWIWQGELPRCIHQNHIFRARCNGQVLSKWVSYYCNALGQHYFHREGRQTTNLASINITILGALPIPIAPIPEQERVIQHIEAGVSSCQHLMNELARSRARSARLRQSILAKALSGQLVPQDPNDEPASILLDRIREQRGKVYHATTRPTSRKKPTVKLK